MPQSMPQGDLTRTISHEPNADYPDEVAVVCRWNVNGQLVERRHTFSREDFFGEGGQSPLDGGALIAAIDRMRRLGP